MKVRTRGVGRDRGVKCGGRVAQPDLQRASGLGPGRQFEAVAVHAVAPRTRFVGTGAAVEEDPVAADTHQDLNPFTAQGVEERAGRIPLIGA